MKPHSIFHGLPIKSRKFKNAEWFHLPSFLFILWDKKERANFFVPLIESTTLSRSPSPFPDTYEWLQETLIFPPFYSSFSQLLCVTLWSDNIHSQNDPHLRFPALLPITYPTISCSHSSLTRVCNLIPAKCNSWAALQLFLCHRTKPKPKWRGCTKKTQHCGRTQYTQVLLYKYRWEGA